jgi:hypothetical protein
MNKLVPPGNPRRSDPAAAAYFAPAAAAGGARSPRRSTSGRGAAARPRPFLISRQDDSAGPRRSCRQALLRRRGEGDDS